MSNSEFQALHDKHFEAGVSVAKSKPYFELLSSKDKALRITNEVCDFVYREIGTYGKDEKQRKAMDAYVNGKAMSMLESAT